MVSLVPSAWTRTPVRIGRTSSLEAARATRSIVSVSGPAGSFAPSAVNSGRRGKSSAGSVRRWKLRTTRRQLDVALLGSQGHGDLAAGQVANHIPQETPGQQQRAFGLNGDVGELHRQADLGIGGGEDEFARAGGELDAAE